MSDFNPFIFKAFGPLISLKRSKEIRKTLKVGMVPNKSFLYLCSHRLQLVALLFYLRFISISSVVLDVRYCPFCVGI
jgi:hypothetical protein